MSHQRMDGFDDPKFWVKRMKVILKNPYISPEYRKRCEAILESEQQKIPVTDNHYPKHRS